VSAPRGFTGGMTRRVTTASIDAPARSAQLGSFDNRPSRPSHYLARGVHGGQGAPAEKPSGRRRGSVPATLRWRYLADLLGSKSGR
jgi:hypothetical protein